VVNTTFGEWWAGDDCASSRPTTPVIGRLTTQSLTTGVPIRKDSADDRSVARAPRIPPELADRPFHFTEGRRYGLSKHHLAGGTWKRLGGGFYSASDTPLIRLTAAKQRLPDTAVFSGHTAAWLHGLDPQPHIAIEATLPPTTRSSRLAGITIRRCQVSADEVSLRNGFRVTSPLRTVIDLVGRLDLVDGVVIVDAALHKRFVGRQQLWAWVESHAGHPGVARIRRAIELAEPATESPMETRLRLLLVLAGLPRPRVQVRLGNDSDFLGRADLYYPECRLVIEYDGATHRSRLESDNRRQNRLVDAGYRVLRFTASDVLAAPASVVDLVRKALSG